MTLKLKYPVQPFHVNQAFGIANPLYTELGLKGHNGIDIMASHGQPVLASHDGIAYPGVDNREGYGVVIRTAEPFDYEGKQVYFKTIYWHLLPQNRRSGFVKAGEVIGFADNTGLSLGDHLHYGLKPQAMNEENGVWWNIEQNNGYFGAIDPAPYFADLFRYYFNYDLRYGETDSVAIINLQRILKQLGYFIGEPTGYYGEMTRKAVLNFQIDKVPLSWWEKYVLRGKLVGPKTRKALNESWG